MCDATLDVIAQIDEHWAERVQREKFQFHNAQWLEIVTAQAQQAQQQQAAQDLARNGHYGGGDDEDDEDGLLRHELGRQGSSSFEDSFEHLVRDADALDQLERSGGDDLQVFK